MDYRLFAVRVWVTDWDRALRFYTETLGIPTTFEFTMPPTKQPWGGVLAHLKDPDGNVLTLLGQG